MADSPSRHSSSSPRPPSPPPAQPKSTNKTSSRNRPLVELIGAQFPAFDCNSAVVLPVQDETARDEAFQKALNEMLLDAALETHAWASARPFHETEMATEKYEKQLLKVQQQEHEQEQTRQRLNEFVARMRSALAALTGGVAH